MFTARAVIGWLREQQRIVRLSSRFAAEIRALSSGKAYYARLENPPRRVGTSAVRPPWLLICFA